MMELYSMCYCDWLEFIQNHFIGIFFIGITSQYWTFKSDLDMRKKADIVTYITFNPHADV